MKRLHIILADFLALHLLLLQRHLQVLELLEQGKANWIKLEHVVTLFQVLELLALLQISSQLISGIVYVCHEAPLSIFMNRRKRLRLSIVPAQDGLGNCHSPQS